MSHPYAKAWATDVVLEFLEKYGRATETFASILGISYQTCKESLVHALRFNQRRYEMLKHTIKNLSKHMDLFTSSRLNNDQKRKYLTYVKWDIQDHVIDQQKIPEI